MLGQTALENEATPLPDERAWRRKELHRLPAGVKSEKLLALRRGIARLQRNVPSILTLQAESRSNNADQVAIEPVGCSKDVVLSSVDGELWDVLPALSPILLLARVAVDEGQRHALSARIFNVAMLLEDRVVARGASHTEPLLFGFLLPLEARLPVEAETELSRGGQAVQQVRRFGSGTIGGLFGGRVIGRCER